MCNGQAGGKDKVVMGLTGAYSDLFIWFIGGLLYIYIMFLKNEDVAGVALEGLV